MTETKTKQSIKTVVREYYESAELTEEQLERLQHMQEISQANSVSPHEKLQAMREQLASRSAGSTPSEKILSIQEGLDPENMPSISTSFQYEQPVASKRKRLSLWLVGLLIAGVFGLVWFSQQPTTSSAGLTPPLLRSVTTYHQQYSQPVEKVASLLELRRRFTALQFNTVASTHLPTSQWQLMGGSTTQFNKQAAVVLYYHHRKTGKRYTLHQMPPWSKQSKLQQAWIGSYNKLPLKVWQERGLLLILVGP